MTNIDRHKKYLAKVPPEVVRQRLKLFRLKDEVMEVLPFICQSFEVRSPFTKYRRWVHPLDPVSLDDLKNWFGVPNESAKLLLRETRTVSDGGRLWAGVTNMTPRALPMKKSFEFKRLDQEQRLAVKETATNLLYGYVDPERVSRPPLSGVVDYMIAAAKAANLKVFAAPDLIVCPDDVVKFQNIAALLFNNILIYGNGQIVTKGKTKIHAFQINHVDV